MYLVQEDLFICLLERASDQIELFSVVDSSELDLLVTSPARNLFVAGTGKHEHEVIANLVPVKNIQLLLELKSEFLLILFEIFKISGLFDYCNFLFVA